MNFPVVDYVKIASNLLPGKISHLVLFVTSRCNNACKYCFNWQNQDIAYTRDELSIQEIGKIAKNFKNLMCLSITGGEPTLRDDMPEICRIFYSCGTRLLQFHSNGYMPDRLAEMVSEISDTCPQMHIDTCISLDGVGIGNDEIRKAHNSFKNILMSVKLIDGMRKKNKRLGLEINTTYSYFTKKNMDKLYSFVTEGLGLSYNVALVRGKARDESAREVSIAEYRDFMRAHFNYTKKTFSRKYPFHSFVAAIRKLSAEISIETLSRQDKILPCLAGKKILVVYDTGEVHPCEMLGRSIGNLRDFGYDLNRLMGTTMARTTVKSIKKNKCYCSWECVIPVNLIFNWKGAYMIVKRWISDCLSR